MTHPFPPETRLSLIARLRDARDEEAWDQFVDLYLPVIYRSARGLGIQDADAQDVAQQVFVAVARALAKRPHDRQQAKFRTWLSRVTRNAAINCLQRSQRDRASGDSAERRQIAALPDGQSVEASILDHELQKETFRAAAKRIQSEFAEDSWQAFWQSAVEGKPIEQVAKALGKQIGSIYAARSRIMRRLRVEIQREQEEQ